jgi:hypothetical protein
MVKAIQPVGERVLRNFKFLKTLASTKSPKKQNKLLKHANCDELLALTEISSNVLNGGFHLNKRQRNRIIPFANLIRKIARARTEKGARRIYKNQQGGQAFLGAILAPILAEAAHQLISKISGNGT